MPGLNGKEKQYRWREMRYLLKLQTFLHQEAKNQDERSCCWKEQSHKFNTSNPFGGKYFFQQVFMLNYFMRLFKSFVNSCLNDFFKGATEILVT